MSNEDDPKKDNDLTRIEDLSEYLHQDDGDEDFSGLSTDPDMALPDDFSSSDERETDFSALEEDLDSLDLTDNFEQEESPTETSFDNDSDFADDSISEENTNFDNESDFGENSEFDNETSFEETPNFEEDSEFEETTNFEENTNFDESPSFEESSDFEETPDSEEKPEFEEASSFEDSSDFSDDLGFEQTTSDESPDSELPPEMPIQNNESDIQESALIKSDDASLEKVPLAQVNTESPSKSQEYAPPETFKDLQNFAKTMSYGNLSQEGNPPFSIILKEIKYQEDLDDIVILLKEFKILSAEDEDAARKTLARGSYLIPRLSEYAAILLCHKLRKYELTILMGLTEEITPAKSYSSDDSGLATKNNIFNNRQHSFLFEKNKVTLNDIIVSTSQNLQGYEIKEYIAVAAQSSLISKDDFTDIDSSSSTENFVYQDLISKLKIQALDKKGNALIGINYTMTPTVSENDQEALYKITCTANIVWLLKN